MRQLARAVVLAVTLTACGGETTPAPTPTPLVDVSGRLACEEFRVVIDEVGLNTMEEVRDSFRAVYDDAKLSMNTRIETAARDALQAMTETDSDAFGAAANELDAACDAVGI